LRGPSRSIAAPSRLQNGAYNDGQRHAILLKLLVEAENMLGHSREQLNDVERQIATIKSIINKQLDTITILKTNAFWLMPLIFSRCTKRSAR